MDEVASATDESVRDSLRRLAASIVREHLEVERRLRELFGEAERQGIDLSRD